MKMVAAVLMKLSENIVNGIGIMYVLFSVKFSQDRKYHKNRTVYLYQWR